MPTPQEVQAAIDAEIANATTTRDSSDRILAAIARPKFQAFVLAIEARTDHPGGMGHVPIRNLARIISDWEFYQANSALPAP